MRNISEIIDRIIAEIPDEFDAEDTLTTDLERIKRAACYHAPEQQHLDWTRLSQCLNYYLPRPAWKQNIADLFEGRNQS